MRAVNWSEVITKIATENEGLKKENERLKKAVTFVKEYVQFCERDRNRRRNTFYLDARKLLKELE